MTAPAARSWVLVTTRWSIWSAREAGVLQRGFPRLDSEAGVAGLTEPLLPHLRPDVARRAPPIEELLGRRLPRRRTRRAPGRRSSSPTSSAAAPSPPVASSGPPGSPIRVSAVTTRLAPSLPSAARSAPSPERTEPTTSYAAARRDRGAAPRAPSSRWSCRGRPARPSRTTPIAPRPPARRGTARRAASTPIVVVSSSYDATVRVPLPPPPPATAAIVVRSRRRYGRYEPQLNNPRMVRTVHARTGFPSPAGRSDRPDDVSVARSRAFTDRPRACHGRSVPWRS